MIGGGTLRGRLRALLQLSDPPWRIALALAVGVFIGCTPFWFIQTLLALIVAAVFRLSKAATVTGAWFNLPWFAPLVYSAALKVGTLVVPGQEAAAAEALTRLLAQPDAFHWREALLLLRGTSFTLLVGTTIVGLGAAAVTYVVALRILTRHGRRDAERQNRRVA